MPDRIAVGPVADLMTALGTERFPVVLASLLRAIAPFSYIVVFGYSGAARPMALFDDFPANKWRIFVGDYQSGPYLLDPFYLACAQPVTAGLYRVKDLAPDRFYQGEYFRSYYIQTGLAEEIGYFVDLPGGVMVVLSLMRTERSFSRREFRALQAASPVVEAAVRRHWADLPQQFSIGLHENAVPRPREDLGRAFATFGQTILTPREREVVEYMLKGHSAEATGIIMSIAPGTVRIHRRNIYTKLGISSQGGLFAQFITTLIDA